MEAALGTGGHPVPAYPAEIRRIVYTTNAVESLNLSLRTIIKARGSFPSVNKWEIVQHWKAALSRWHDSCTRGFQQTASHPGAHG